MIGVDHNLNFNDLTKYQLTDKDNYLVRCLIRYTYLFEWN